MTASGTVDVPLTAVNQPGGLKMIVVPLTGTRAVVVESRRLGGYDSGYAAGALVYLLDVAVANQQGPIRVVPLNESDSAKGSAPLTLGGSTVIEGVTVSVISAGGSGDTVRIVK